MIQVLLFSQAIAAQPRAPDLAELSSIVAPYGECEFRREAEVQLASDKWLAAVQRKRAKPEDTEVAREASNLFDRLTVLRAEIRQSCGYEQVHRRLQARLVALHLKMDTARAYWEARSVFTRLNYMNEHLLRMRAGVFPAAPAPPALPTPIITLPHSSKSK